MSPSLVMTHGWKDSSAAWTDVAVGLPGIAIDVWDLPYHGGAGPLARPEEPARDELLDLLDSRVDSLPPPVVLVGHSLGGYLSLAYALTHPSKVAGLVLISTGPGFRSEEPRAAWNQWAKDNADPDVPGEELVVLQHDAFVINELDRIDVPTLVLQGERDRQYDAAREVFARRLNNVRTEVIEGGGHNVHRKQHDAVAGLIADWLGSL